MGLKKQEMKLLYKTLDFTLVKTTPILISKTKHTEVVKKNFDLIYYLTKSFENKKGDGSITSLENPDKNIKITINVDKKTEFQ